MGNRAIIVMDTPKPTSIAIYLHWNGGRDSVESFLLATRKRMGGRLGDVSYGIARLIQVVTAHFPGALSVGVSTYNGSAGDNGVYVVSSKTMEIIDRLDFDSTEQNDYDPEEFSDHIVDALNKADEYYQREDDPEPEVKPTAEKLIDNVPNGYHLIHNDRLPVEEDSITFAITFEHFNSVAPPTIIHKGKKYRRGLIQVMCANGISASQYCSVRNYTLQK